MNRVNMAPRQGGGDRWEEQRVRGMVKRGHREGEDSTRGCPGNQVVRGGEERGDLEGGALMLTNDRIIGCTERERERERGGALIIILYQGSSGRAVLHHFFGCILFDVVIFIINLKFTSILIYF